MRQAAKPENRVAHLERREEPLAVRVGQNVGKRDSAVRAALGLFEKADGDGLGDRVARG